MATICLTDGMYEQMLDIMVKQKTGHVQVHQPRYPSQRDLHETIEDAEVILANLDEDPDLRAATGRVFGYALLGADDQASGGYLIGIMPSREAAVSGMDEQVVAGRYLGTKPALEALVGSGLADALQIEVGAELVAVTQAADGSLGNEIYTVVGLVTTGSTVKDRTGVFLHHSDLQSLLSLEGRIHEIVLLATERDAVTALSDATRRRLGERDLLVRTWSEADPGLARIIGSQNASVEILLLLVFSVAALGVLNTMLMAVFERTRELGVMRAVGMSRGRMMMLVILEAASLALVASVLGGAAGLALDLYLVEYGLDLSRFTGGLTWGGVIFEPVMYGQLRVDRIAQTLAALFSISILACIWPAWRAAQLQPIEAMRQDA
jgi:ABC-type lipoprotein release transport system permease subunit